MRVDTDALMDAALEQGFAVLLSQIVANDTNYDVRAGLLMELLATANSLNYPAGIRIDPEQPHWPVVYVELPTGQVSWHVKQHVNQWDGHTTEEKLERIARFLKGMA